MCCKVADFAARAKGSWCSISELEPDAMMELLPLLRRAFPPDNSGMPNRESFDLMVPFASDPARCLRMIIDELRDGLYSDDERYGARATHQVLEALDWLYDPHKVETEGERERRMMEEFLSIGIPPQVARALARREAPRVTDRPVGRPLVTGPESVTALRLYWNTDRTWREITFETKGACCALDPRCPEFCATCQDTKRPYVPPSRMRQRIARMRCAACGSTRRSPLQRESVCAKHVAALRANAIRLERFLRANNACSSDALRHLVTVGCSALPDL
jgi:hypothetical protein